MINKNQLSRIRALFDRALDLPPEQRLGFVRAETADDEQVRQAVLAMLAADESSQGHEDDHITMNVVDDFIGALQNDSDTQYLGMRIGPYRVESLLGRGGMGLVYRAERVEGDFEQQVAIKFLRLNDAHLSRRLIQERTALGKLNHPNIARIFDAGALEDGSPYLIMEYVDGLSLAAYLENRRLSLRQRLELFLTVCAAVDHSHRRLIIHRDLKPSNIMIGADGQPKLLDFGIAKSLLGEDGSQTTTMEQAWSPNYTSPEQVRGEPLTTSVDIYALGLLLYRLISGRDAQDTQGLSLDQTVQRICQQSPPDLNQQGMVPRDLNRIVFKAIHKDSQQRYASARELADDVRRFLRNEPVNAVGDRLSYRIGKWVRRHRMACGVGLISVVMLVTAAVQVVIQRNNALIAEQAATLQLARANEVTDFLLETFRAADLSENRGEEITVEALLDSAFDDIQQRRDLSVPLRTQLIQTIGKAYSNSGQRAKGLQAAQLSHEAFQGQSDIDELQRAEFLVAAGDLMMRAALTEGPVEGIELMREALQIYQRRLPEDDVRLVDLNNDLGSALINARELDEAEQYMQAALAGAPGLAAERPLFEAVVRHNAARLEHLQDNDAEARELIDRSLAIKQTIYGSDEVGYADGLLIRSQIARDMGDWDQAGSDLEQATAIYKAELAPDNSSIQVALNELANYYHDLGQYEQAETAYLESLAHPALQRDPALKAVGLNNLAFLYVENEQYQRAMPMFKESLELRRQAHGNDAITVATAANNLGDLYRILGQYELSQPLLEEALGIRREKFGAQHSQTIETELRLMMLAVERGDLNSAGPMLESMEQHLLDSDTANPGSWITLHQVQSDYWLARQDRQQAAEHLRKGYQRLVEHYGEQHPLAERLLQQVEALESDEPQGSAN